MNRALSQLRIGWTIFCGVLGLLLIALWVRSYWYIDIVLRYNPTSTLSAISERGVLGISHDRLRGPAFIPTWNYVSSPANNKKERPKHMVLGFWLVRLPDQVGISVPHWFLVVIAIVMGSSPWTQWRFSLRTLLIAMTVVAAGLGFIMWLAKR